ncbi:phage portal protein [Neobacillus cucumis]|uniref:Phage portal protein n=1 Tax=Neobacillus cucumis TaxID=1740721 RepID=A0A2N5HES1_9BACI|nr:phage portal protein [Neobacillus cucumis]PLS04029.1 phage portal protein [Neobacillus cucumis]
MNQDEIILKLIENIDLHKPHHTKLKHYYDGKHDILFEKGKSDPTKSDMRAYFNYAHKMVQNQVGYILGKPVNYTSKGDNKEFLNLIDYYFSPWEKEHNINLKLKSAIHGFAYEVSFINTNGDFQCTHFSPLEMAVLHDSSVDSKVSLAVRKYKLQFDDTEYVEVWDNINYTRYSNSGQLALLERKPHRFSRCPVRKLKNNDNEKSTYADIIKIIDMYNALHSVSVQEMMDFRNAYLVLSNCELDQETAQKMKENGIIILPNEKAKAEWLTKNPNSQFFKDLLDNLKDEIYIQSNQVNLNESFQSNTSGVAIRLKLQELENQSAIAESIFERVLKDRLSFFCEFLKIAENKEYDFKDINIAFTRNVPVDEASIVTMVRELQGIVPQEELLSWLPRISNPAVSIKKLKEEQDSTGINTDLMSGLNG